VDIGVLAPLLTEQGPFVTLYLPTHRDSEAAAGSWDVLWKDVLRELEELGVDAATRAALDQGRGSHTEGGTQVYVAAHGRLLLHRALPEAQDNQVVRVGPLPYLLPLLDWAQTRVPHLVVLVDRRGADILAYTDDDQPVEVDTVVGDQHRIQVENTWEENARDVAVVVERVAREIGARVVLLAGDTKELTLLRRDLPPSVAGLVTVIDGSRHLDGGDDHTAEEVVRALGEHSSREVGELLERFQTYRGRATKDRATPIRDDEGNHAVALDAADGVADTVAALRMAQVDTLLLAEDLDEDRPVWAGPEPLHLGLTAEEITALGVAAPFEVPLVDGLVRAALGGAAQVRLVPTGTGQTPREGVGALLRYSTPS